MINRTCTRSLSLWIFRENRDDVEPDKVFTPFLALSQSVSTSLVPAGKG